MTEFNLNKFMHENVSAEHKQLVTQQMKLIAELKEVIARRIEFEVHTTLNNILHPNDKVPPRAANPHPESS